MYVQATLPPRTYTVTYKGVEFFVLNKAFLLQLNIADEAEKQ